jgi:hypothetical protein
MKTSERNEPPNSGSNSTNVARFNGGRDGGGLKRMRIGSRRLLLQTLRAASAAFKPAACAALQDHLLQDSSNIRI